MVFQKTDVWIFFGNDMQNPEFPGSPDSKYPWYVVLGGEYFHQILEFRNFRKVKFQISKKYRKNTVRCGSGTSSRTKPAVHIRHSASYHAHHVSQAYTNTERNLVSRKSYINASARGIFSDEKNFTCSKLFEKSQLFNTTGVTYRSRRWSWCCLKVTEIDFSKSYNRKRASFCQV